MQKTNKGYSMYNKINIRPGIFWAIMITVASLLTTTVFAQKEPGKKTSTIDINSVYKPVLRNAVKINETQGLFIISLTAL